jgi:hypothetical protein
VVDEAGRTITNDEWQRGKAYWLDADPPGLRHADVNDTTQPIEVIVVELQRDRKRGRSLPAPARARRSVGSALG